MNYYLDDSKNLIENKVITFALKDLILSSDNKRVLSSTIDGDLSPYVENFLFKEIKIKYIGLGRRYTLNACSVDYYSNEIDVYFTGYSNAATNSESFKATILKDTSKYIIKYLGSGLSVTNWAVPNYIEFVLEDLPT